MSRTIPPADAILFKSPARVLHRIARPAAARRACRMLARRELWLRARRADSARGLAAVDDFVAQLRETEARRLTEIHGYDTGALAREFHGCFSRRPLPEHAPGTCAARPRSRARARMMGWRLRGEDVAISPPPQPSPSKRRLRPSSTDYAGEGAHRPRGAGLCRKRQFVFSAGGGASCLSTPALISPAVICCILFIRSTAALADSTRRQAG